MYPAIEAVSSAIFCDYNGAPFLAARLVIYAKLRVLGRRESRARECIIAVSRRKSHAFLSRAFSVFSVGAAFLGDDRRRRYLFSDDETGVSHGRVSRSVSREM